MDSIDLFIDFCFATPNGINAATAGGDTTLILIIQVEYQFAFAKTIVIIDTPMSFILGLNVKIFWAQSTEVKGKAAAREIVTLQVLFAGFVIAGSGNSLEFPAII